MDKRKFIKKLERNIGIKKLKNQIRAMNLLYVFLILGGAFAVYINHSGLWLSYGLIVAGVALLLVAFFMSYRVKLQVKLNNIKMDYRENLVIPYARRFFEDGQFSKIGGITERDVISTNMFPDSPDYKYTTCNELKGKHKNVKFVCTDVFEDSGPNEMHVRGRLFSINIATDIVNPVILISAAAPALEISNKEIKKVQVKNDVIDRMFNVYAFDENEANNLLTDNMVYKIRQLIGLQLGKIYRICFMNGRIYFYFTTEGNTYEEVLTKKHDVERELGKIREKFSVAGKIIDIL